MRSDSSGWPPQKRSALDFTAHLAVVGKGGIVWTTYNNVLVNMRKLDGATCSLFCSEAGNGNRWISPRCAMVSGESPRRAMVSGEPATGHSAPLVQFRPRSVSRMIVPAHDQRPPLPAPADPPVIECKKCKVPLPDTTWKNCASCRRNRTESYNRWKKSALLRSTTRMNLSESLLRRRQRSSSLNRTIDYTSLSQAPGPDPTAPLDHHSNEPGLRGDASGSSPLANDQPRRTSTPAVPRPAEAIEYQWSDELIEALLALPPRSSYIGTFSIVADPAVNNSTRVRLFADQLRARAVHISCVVPSHAPFPLSPTPTLTFSAWCRVHSQTGSVNAGSSNCCALVSYCTCQEGCQGRFVVSADDDLSHPYGVPGQRIGVVVIHQGPPD